jgi:hypothetical protein
MQGNIRHLPECLVMAGARPDERNEKREMIDEHVRMRMPAAP